MKTKILISILFTMIFVNCNLLNAQQDSPKEVYPTRLSAKISIQNFNNEGLNDYFGNVTLIGAGIGKQISDDFKLDGFVDIGAKEKEDVKMNYTQVGGMIKYSWYAFGSDRPNFYGGLGAAYVSLKLSGSGYGETENGSSFGFMATIGIEIPLGTAILDFGWNSVWCNMEIEDDNNNVGSQIFYGGLIFSF